jgi:hypothetical protein
MVGMDAKVPALYEQWPPKDDPVLPLLVEGLESGRLSWEEAASVFPGQFRSMFLLLAHTVSWRLMGRRVVSVSREMQRLFARTSLAGIEAPDLDLEHPSIYFSLVDSEFELWGGPRTQWHRCHGVYMTLARGDASSTNPKEEPVVELKFYLWGDANKRSQGQGDDASFWFSVNLAEMTENGWDLETYLNTVLSDRTREVTGTVASHPQGMRDVAMLIRLVINAALYLGSEDGEAEFDAKTIRYGLERQKLEADLDRIKNRSKGKARRIQRRLDEIPQEKIWWVGAHTPPQKEGPLVAGSWWPRKDILRERLREGLAQAREAQAQLKNSREALRDVDGDFAGAVRQVAADLRVVNNQKSRLEDLSANLSATRRWVRPRPHKGDTNGE